MKWRHGDQGSYGEFAMANKTDSIITPGEPPHPGMVWIPGETFRMGSEDFYPEERPVHEVTVDGFWKDHKEYTPRLPTFSCRVAKLRFMNG